MKNKETIAQQGRKICMSFNNLSIYRRAIYSMIDQKYTCDWFIEDCDTGVKAFPETDLKRVSKLPIVNLGAFYWEKGLVGLFRRDYDIYFMLGATRNISLFVFCLFSKLFWNKKKRVYLWTHGVYGKESKIEWMFWKRPMLKMADGIFTYGDYAKKLLVENGFDESKIFPIHNSLDYDSQLKIREDLAPSAIYENHFENTNPVVIFIGRLTPVKKLDMLINAVGLLKQKGKLYNVVFVGDGSERKKLEKLSVENKIESNVWFYGECYDERQNAELVYNADICVAPGNIGLTAMHSLMFGCPAISHNNFSFQMPEFEAIKPGETGDFFEFGSVEDLADTIEHWFSIHANKRESIRSACYQVIDTSWNPYYQIKLIQQVFSSIER